MYYSEHGSVVPYNRKEIWTKIGGKKNWMDKAGLYYPEDDGFNPYHAEGF